MQRMPLKGHHLADYKQPTKISFCPFMALFERTVKIQTGSEWETVVWQGLEMTQGKDEHTGALNMGA